MDPTQRGDEVAAIMRDYYEANKPLHWWQRRRRYESEVADNLMIGLANIAVIEMEKRGYRTYPADAHRLREAATAFVAKVDACEFEIPYAFAVETGDALGALRSALSHLPRDEADEVRRAIEAAKHDGPADAQPYLGEVNRG